MGLITVRFVKHVYEEKHTFMRKQCPDSVERRSINVTG
jgi:hypothetical protein